MFLQPARRRLLDAGQRVGQLAQEALKEARERAGMTQAELAKRARISIRTIQGWEQGNRSPASPDFFRLVQALGVSADAFAGITEGDRRPPKRGKPKRPRSPTGDE